MRRADRLFQLVQLLRGRRRTVTAAWLAEQLEVSERTVYRDIQALVGSGVPIQGEAGVGYRVERGFELPPMMFSLDEIDALVLGARVVARWGDAELRQSARTILTKVEAVLPESERHRLEATALFARPGDSAPEVLRFLGPLRRATREQRKVEVVYRDSRDQPSQRVLRPLGLYFWGETWLLASYCELRQDFRNFRVDRMSRVVVCDESFELKGEVTLEAYIEAMQNS